MGDDNRSLTSPALSNQEDDVNSETEARTLTQEDVNEQVNFYIAQLTKQLEDFTRLIQGLSLEYPPLKGRTLTKGQVTAPVLLQPVTNLNLVVNVDSAVVYFEKLNRKTADYCHFLSRYRLNKTKQQHKVAKLEYLCLNYNSWRTNLCLFLTSLGSYFCQHGFRVDVTH